jgi:hypothetical protein
VGSIQAANYPGTKIRGSVNGFFFFFQPRQLRFLERSPHCTSLLHRVFAELLFLLKLYPQVIDLVHNSNASTSNASTSNIKLFS